MSSLGSKPLYIIGTHLSPPPSFLHKLSPTLAIAQEVSISHIEETVKVDLPTKSQEAIRGTILLCEESRGHGPSLSI